MAKVSIERDPETPALLEKANNELRETPELREEALEALRKLLVEDGTLDYADREDVLIRYLRPTKFYPESALALMKREAEFKKKHEDVLKGLVPDSLKDVMLGDCPVNVLAQRDQHGRRILVSHCGKLWNTSLVSNTNVFQLFYLVHQAALLEPCTQISGVVVILDFHGLGLKQIANLTPKFALLLLSFIQKCMPLRLKAVHIVNEPFLFKGVWKIFSPLIEDKLSKRIYFNGEDRKKLHAHINPECLPTTYGGTLPLDYSAKDWYPILKSLEDVIVENNKFQLKKK